MRYFVKLQTFGDPVLIDEYDSYSAALEWAERFVKSDSDNTFLVSITTDGPIWHSRHGEIEVHDKSNSVEQGDEAREEPMVHDLGTGELVKL